MSDLVDTIGFLVLAVSVLVLSVIAVLVVVFVPESRLLYLAGLVGWLALFWWFVKRKLSFFLLTLLTVGLIDAIIFAQAAFNQAGQLVLSPASSIADAIVGAMLLVLFVQIWLPPISWFVFGLLWLAGEAFLAWFDVIEERRLWEKLVGERKEAEERF